MSRKTGRVFSPTSKANVRANLLGGPLTAFRSQHGVTTVDTWNGDIPDSKGKTNGLRQDGFDPIGLEASFPGLVPASVVAAGMPAGQIMAADFVSFRSFTYTVLRMDRGSLSVRVMGIPAILDPIQLYDPATEATYEQQQAQEILRFQLLAQ